MIYCFQDYNAKLSDFGLAKDGPEGDNTHVSTRVMGTQGYAAPEYIMTGTYVNPPEYIFKFNENVWISLRQCQKGYNQHNLINKMTNNNLIRLKLNTQLC